MVHCHNHSKAFSLGLVAVSVLLAGGCGLVPDGAGMAVTDIPTDGVSPPASERGSFAFVRLVNATGVAVDTQFFVATDEADVASRALFEERNRFVRGIGFLSGGVLAPEEGVALDLPCGSQLLVGTMGGELLDPETGETVAVGATARLAELGPQFDCGGVVTFTFSIDDSGQPEATLSIQ
jgi:hypothetical protein